MKYFIASRWANMKAVQILTENLTTLGHQVFSYVADPRNFVTKEELKETPSFFKDAKNWRTNTGLREAYERQLEGIQQSDIFVLLLPAGESSHIAAGIAFGLNKKTILVGKPETVKTHYLIFDEYYPDVDAYLVHLRKS